MASRKIEYASSSALTISPASLASSSSFTAGVESDAVDNTTNKYLDYLLAGKITVGTTPTINTEIRVYVAALIDDSTYPDVLDGTGSAETRTSAGSTDSALVLARVLNVDATTTDRAYWFGPVSVASLFGGTMPKKFVVFVTHNTGVNLNSTGGNHAISITPTYETIA
jgi:hypothetical protein